LLDIAIFPYYGQIEVSDVIGCDLPQSYGQTTGAVFTDHTVDVFTMFVDQAVERDQNVRVRVYRGSDTTGLGSLVFDRDIEFTQPPRLGVYQPLTDEPKTAVALFDRPHRTRTDPDLRQPTPGRQ